MSTENEWPKMLMESATECGILKAENAELFDKLDTACNLLETVGSVTFLNRRPVMTKCENCHYEQCHEDFGNDINHSAACDVPTVFALRDKIRARMDAAKRAEMAK